MKRLGYRQNPQEFAVPKKFGKYNRPIVPETKAGTSYIVNPAGSGNTREVEVSMYPTKDQMLMTPNK
jgi:hypothetical protein